MHVRINIRGEYGLLKELNIHREKKDSVEIIGQQNDTPEYDSV